MDRGAAEPPRCRRGANIWILRFAADGRCAAFEEWVLARTTRLSRSWHADRGRPYMSSTTSRWTASAPCAPRVEIFSMSEVRLGPDTSETAEGRRRPGA
jgi:hypothetical protein